MVSLTTVDFTHKSKKLLEYNVYIDRQQVYLIYHQLFKVYIYRHGLNFKDSIKFTEHFNKFKQCAFI